VVEGGNTPQGRKTLAFVVGSDDTVFAIDADTGKILWQKKLPQQAHGSSDGHLAVFEYAERNPGD
jgi:outer membrane protein assembly factor BamB